VSPAPEGEDFLLILRPEIPITASGPAGAAAYTGLVDTGSDITILPLSAAVFLGVEARPAPGPAASVFGGHEAQLLEGEITFQIQDANETVRWRDTVCFFDFSDRGEETVILGHSGFLDYFTATFDGKAGALTLVANDELPAV
jgi:hypothetical protein